MLASLSAGSDTCRLLAPSPLLLPLRLVNTLFLLVLLVPVPCAPLERKMLRARTIDVTAVQLNFL